MVQKALISFSPLRKQEKMDEFKKKILARLQINNRKAAEPKSSLLLHVTSICRTSMGPRNEEGK